MHGLQKQQAIMALKARIAAIEKRPVLAEGAAALGQAKGRGFLAAAPGLMHEVYSNETRNGAASLGFCLGQARDLITPERPAVFFMQLLHEGQEQGLPYGPGLAAFGFAPESLTLVRVRTTAELLWAAEESLGCPAVATVIADIGGAPKVLDFTASRRLSLRAMSGGTSLFLMRYGGEREATAAQLRWRIDPVLSAEMPFDPRAPGSPRWQVTLEKDCAGLKQRHGSNWQVDWNHGFDIAYPKARESRLTG